MIQFTKPMRAVSAVFLHCSASDAPEHDSVDVMRQWHLANGWADVGYHYFIKKDGTIQPGRPLEMQPAAQSEYNPGTIAICAHGLRRDAFTPAQFGAIVDLCTAINRAYGGGLRFRGHVEVYPKACPVYDYVRVLGLDAQGRMTRTPDTSSQVGGVVAGNLPSSMNAGPTPVSDPGKHGASRWPAATLRLMSTGSAVIALQKALGVVADGDFGKVTEKAVMDYQQANGLVVDGIAGPATLAKMGLA